MSNVLKMAKSQSIQQLRTAGWSQRRIASELEIDRGTVARHLQAVQAASNAAILPPGFASENLFATVGVPASLPRGRPNQCEPLRDLILAKLDQQLSAKRIWQDLTCEHGFVGSYDSVKRFLRGLGATTPLPLT